MPWRTLGVVISAVLLLAAFTPALAQDMQKCFAAADKVKDGVALDDTWEYDAFTGWSQRPALGIPALEGHAMVYGSFGGVTWLFGGRRANGVLSDELYMWDGVGWNFVDTNIPTAPPQVGCWWNPWYGYICEGFQESKSVDGFAYQAGAGVNVRMTPALSLSGSYRMNWVDYPKADGTPTFDAIQLILHWAF